MEYSLFKLYCMFVNKDKFYDEDLKCVRLIDLKDIADRFKIPIDRSRINDYEILNISVISTNNYLKIYDKKLKKEYFSEYSYLSNICNIKEVFGDIKSTVAPQFINVTIIGKESKCEYIYFIDGDIPIVERLSYIDECCNDFYDKIQITKYNRIEFEKKYPSLTLSKIEYNVDYIKGINCNDFGISETVLLNKQYNDFCNEEYNKFKYSLAFYPQIRHKYSDKNICCENNRINYYINIPNEIDNENSFCGVCLEDINSNMCNFNTLLTYFNKYSYYDVSLFNDYKEVKSILLFSQNTDYNEENDFVNENTLEVFKTDEEIVIRYSVVPEKIHAHELKHDNIKTNDIIIPKQIDNCFNESELDNISRMVAIFIFFFFIKRVLYEIYKYKNLLQLKCNNYYFDDPLSPILFSNIDTNDIEKMISKKPEYYFNIIRHQFDKFINKKNIDSNKTKVLKYKK